MDNGGWFDWDEGNEEHVLDHGIDPAEVEEAMLDSNRLKDDARNVAGERREALIGATEDGRACTSFTRAAVKKARKCGPSQPAPPMKLRKEDTVEAEGE